MKTRRTLLLPLVPMYAAIVGWKKRLFDKGRLRRRRLPDAVISIGSVSSGGAGKTPVVLLLADMLKRREYAVRILTRGYGRKSKQVQRVDPAGDARRYGDEPLLLAQRSGSPVYVGADRYRAGLMAQADAAGKKIVHLLDDGFQHRQLQRDLDIVLLTRKDVEDVLLPAGDLREPLATLRDADVIVVRQDEAESLQEFISRMTRDQGPPPIWLIRRRLKFAASGATLPTRPLAFCGIARPESFVAMLEAETCRPAASVIFGDHHRYDERDISRLLERAKETSADGFVTTEKDAVKLTKAMRRRLEWAGPLVVPELEVTLVDERAALEQMISMAGRMNRRKNR